MFRQPCGISCHFNKGSSAEWTFGQENKVPEVFQVPRIDGRVKEGLVPCYTGGKHSGGWQIDVGKSNTDYRLFVSKDLTVLLLINADGTEKLTPIVIGKSLTQR
ncbi:hypothetical protein PR048_023575 [Dryococelus australis]|uniref:Uncharacterized protein n=1 Tax=Dryococelus australis TaxID=614101 RepID=A0ABQ9GUI4_9NEOP|nr:hypothetical protein PR048_023575 [Dryococelus australis]